MSGCSKIWDIIDNYITRITDTTNTSSKVTGERDIDQIYAAIKINSSKLHKNFKITNYSKINYVHHTFNEFSETGNNQALHFNKHKLLNQFISVGSAINYDKNINSNLYSTFLDVEFIQDLTKNKEIKANYTSNTSKTYVYSLKNAYSSTIKMSTGIKLDTINNWTYSMNIMRLRRSNKNFENSLDILIAKTF